MFFVWIFFAGGGLGLHFSPFTHLPYILYMTWVWPYTQVWVA